MKWSYIPLNPAPKVLRQFAVAWFLFVLAVGLWQHLAKDRALLGAALVVLAFLVGVPGWFKPSLVRWAFVAWMALAFPIGWIISLLTLLLMYFLVLTPVALFFRITGRDLLRRKPARDCASFWLPKETPQDVRSYFRQY